ncbi:NAD(P)-dependent oxidoreductase [Streptomyces sp. NPDC056529]|uniref:NAD(P)-dependent oxidoreductase n=1 Tax=Streptomyces sp. NPDC056529 TaxID=3345855 RepID=UPI0036BB1B3A
MTRYQRPVALVAHRMNETAVARLADLFAVRHCDGTDRAAVLAAAAGADVLLAGPATTVDAALLAAAPRLRCVARAGTGPDRVDRVDLAAAAAAGVLVVDAPSCAAVSVAEHAVGLLLATAGYTGLAGATAGILGLGRIGSLVAERLAAFDMELVACDPYVSTARAGRLKGELVSLDELLVRSDFITVHLPPTPQTAGLLGEEALRRVRPHVRIVNTSRGGIVDEAALAAALREGRVGGAGVDAFALERGQASPLLAFDSVIATPNLATATAEALERADLAVVDALRGILPALRAARPAQAHHLTGTAR